MRPSWRYPKTKMKTRRKRLTWLVQPWLECPSLCMHAHPLCLGASQLSCQMSWTYLLRMLMSLKGLTLTQWQAKTSHLKWLKKALKSDGDQLSKLLIEWQEVESLSLVIFLIALQASLCLGYQKKPWSQISSLDKHSQLHGSSTQSSKEDSESKIWVQQELRNKKHSPRKALKSTRELILWKHWKIGILLDWT